MFIESMISFLLASVFSSYSQPNIAIQNPTELGSISFVAQNMGGDTGVGDILLNTKKNPERVPHKIKGLPESLGISITAHSAIVVDEDSGTILFSKNPDEKRPIASLSKLMTAMVFLENNPGWNVSVEVQQKHRTVGSNMKVPNGTQLTTKQLFDLMLIGSKNDAALALVEATSLSQYAFVRKMNEKSIALGLDTTFFVEPTGLNENNVSSATDIAKMLHFALEYPEIQKSTSTNFYFGPDFIEANTNLDLLESYLNDKVSYTIVGGKTGFITESGYCLTSMFQNSEDNTIIAVALGSDDITARHHEVKAMATWTYDNYDWR